MSWKETLLQQLAHRDALEKVDGGVYTAFQRVYDRLNKADDLVRKLGSTDTQRELQQTLELNEQHRVTISENKQKIRSLEEKLTVINAKLRTSSSENTKLNSVVVRLIEKLNTQTEEYQHKNKSIELLNDEFLATQIQNNLLFDKVNKLERENAELVERWLLKVQQDADKINEMLEGSG